MYSSIIKIKKTVPSENMAETRKQIAFDLDTKALEAYYPNKHWRGSYEIIKKHMTKYT